MAGSHIPLPRYMILGFLQLFKRAESRVDVDRVPTKTIVLVIHAARNFLSGTIVPRSPMDTGHPTPDETKAGDAWEVRETSAFIEVSFRVADSAKHDLGDTQSAKVA